MLVRVASAAQPSVSHFCCPFRKFCTACASSRSVMASIMISLAVCTPPGARFFTRPNSSPEMCSSSGAPAAGRPGPDCSGLVPCSASDCQ